MSASQPLEVPASGVAATALYHELPKTAVRYLGAGYERINRAEDLVALQTLLSEQNEARRKLMRLTFKRDLTAEDRAAWARDYDTVRNRVERFNAAFEGLNKPRTYMAKRTRDLAREESVDARVLAKIARRVERRAGVANAVADELEGNTAPVRV